MRGTKFTFSKAVAEQFAEAIANGTPIIPPPGGWNQDAALTLAGVLLAVIQKDTLLDQRDSGHAIDIDKLLRWGADYSRAVSLMIMTGLYDDGYDPIHQVNLVLDEHGDGDALPVRGCKFARQHAEGN